MNRSRNKELVSNTVFMFVGTFGTKFISFFMVPVYTYCLTAPEYGVVDLVFTASMLLTPVVALNIHEAVMRFVLDEGADVDAITSSGVAVFVLGTLIALVLIPVFLQFETIAPYAIELYLLIVGTAFLYLVQSFMKGMNHIKLFSLCGVLVTLVTASSNILMLAVFHLGIHGYLVSTLVSYIGVALFAFFKSGMFRYISLKKIDFGVLGPMISYSVVLVPNSLMWWVVNSSNRLIIASFLGASANGIFAVSNKLPTLLNSVTSVFQQTWQLSAIKADDDEDKNAYGTQVFALYSAAIWIASSLILLITKPFMILFVEPSYYEAWRYTPFLIVSFAFLSFASYVGTYYSVAKNNKGMVASAFVGLLVNTVLNFLLIPFVGLQGASVSACFSYLAIFVFRYFDTKKHVSIDVFTRRFCISGILVVAQCFFMYVDCALEYVAEVVVLVGLLVVNWGLAKMVAVKVSASVRERIKRG